MNISRLVNDILTGFMLAVFSTIVAFGIVAIFSLASKNSAPKFNGVALMRFDAYPAACSAFIMSDTVAVTARHCVTFTLQDGAPIMPYQPNLTQGENVALIRSLNVSNGRDIAVLFGDFRRFEKTKVNFTSRTIVFGHTYTSCGHPHGQLPMYCVELGEPVLQGHDFVKFGQSIEPGMSGGPVFDDSTGEVVGINSAGANLEFGGGTFITVIIGSGNLANEPNAIQPMPPQVPGP